MSLFNIIKIVSEVDKTIAIKDKCCFDAKIAMYEHPQSKLISDDVYDALDALHCDELFQVFEIIAKDGMPMLIEVFKEKDNVDLHRNEANAIVRMSIDVLKEWKECKEKQKATVAVGDMDSWQTSIDRDDNT